MDALNNSEMKYLPPDLLTEHLQHVKELQNLQVIQKLREYDSDTIDKLADNSALVQDGVFLIRLNRNALILEQMAIMRLVFDFRSKLNDQLYDQLRQGKSIVACSSMKTLCDQMIDDFVKIYKIFEEQITIPFTIGDEDKIILAIQEVYKMKAKKTPANDSTNKESQSDISSTAENYAIRMLPSLGTDGAEDKISLAIQELNKTIVDRLTDAMREMSKTMQPVKDVMLARITQNNGNQPQQLAGNADNQPAKDDTEKLTQPVNNAPHALSKLAKDYVRYQARGDYDGNTEENEFSFKKGEIFYVYKEKKLNGHLWFKAHKPKIENPEEPNTSEKGLISTDHVKMCF